MLIETPVPTNDFKEILQAIAHVGRHFIRCFFFFESRSCWQTAVLVGVNVLDRLGQQCHSSDTDARRQLGRKEWLGR